MPPSALRLQSSAHSHADELVRLFRWIAWLVFAAWLLATPASADDWPFFRGPASSGISAETDWTANWPASGPEVAWRTNVGIGASSVVVVGNRLFTMGSLDGKDQDAVFCLDRSNGEILWQFNYPSKFDVRQFEGGPASTPTVDGSYVYALGYLGPLFCLNIKDGQLVWHKHLVDDFGGRYSPWKYAGSPLVTGNSLIVDTGADGNSTVALEKTTGKRVYHSHTFPCISHKPHAFDAKLPTLVVSSRKMPLRPSP